MARNVVAWCGVIILVTVGGCARAYHAYPCGCVPYGYCPPAPLAYTTYEGCPTPVATCYASEHPPGRATPPPMPVTWMD